MALFIQKPIFWNTNDYRSPSGIIATSGYPQKTGYGHEEWNNSPRMLLTTSTGERYRVFHTEGAGQAPLDDNAGQTFVFMTVSHDGVQELVGIAGNAMGLFDDKYLPLREEIVDKLQLDTLSQDAWGVENVQMQYRGNRRAFMRDWNTDVHWIPNWVCPDELFWWLDDPVLLNPAQITGIPGRQRLLTMFNSYTKLDLATAYRYLDAIPVAQRHAQWQRLREAIGCTVSEPLAAEDMPDGTVPATTVLATVQARRGQGQFRTNLIQAWNGACAVTGLTCNEVLRASHVKPWVNSTARERLDSNNGLLLSANLDALFDKGLITFVNNGQMQISSRLSPQHRAALGLPQPLRHPLMRNLQPTSPITDNTCFTDGWLLAGPRPHHIGIRAASSQAEGVW